MPWKILPLHNSSLLSDTKVNIPRPLVIDNTTLHSLDNTYDTLDQDLTQRLNTLSDKMNSAHEVTASTSFAPLLYFSIALASCNFISMWIMYGVLSKRFTTYSPQVLQPKRNLFRVKLTAQLQFYVCLFWPLCRSFQKKQKKTEKKKQNRGLNILTWSRVVISTIWVLVQTCKISSPTQCYFFKGFINCNKIQFHQVANFFHTSVLACKLTSI